MIPFRSEQTIGRSAMDVWEYAADVDRHPTWMSVLDAELLQGRSTEVGARAREKGVRRADERPDHLGGPLCKRTVAAAEAGLENLVEVVDLVGCPVGLGEGHPRVGHGPQRRGREEAPPAPGPS